MPNNEHTGYKVDTEKYIGPGGIPPRLFDNLIWGIDEVSRFTSYAKGTIYNLVSEGDIPYRKRRGKLWFIPSEVMQWLKGEL